MLNHVCTMLSLALLLPTGSAWADNIFYVVNTTNQFGTVDLATGEFTQIGPNTPEGEQGLIPGPNGSLLTLTYSGNLDAINPKTGAATVVGATGLGDCSMPSVSCPSNSANSLASTGGKVYATDLANDLYSVNPVTGAAKLIGSTGIPAVPFIPTTINPDGTLNAYDEGLFGANGELYATFDAFHVNLSTFAETAVVAPELYEINPVTGHATLIGSVPLNLNAVGGLNNSWYAFDNGTDQVFTLNLTNGQTALAGTFSDTAGFLAGATATPEPDSLALAGWGTLLIVLCSVVRRIRAAKGGYGLRALRNRDESVHSNEVAESCTSASHSSSAT